MESESGDGIVSTDKKRLAVVTGANRGLGYEACRALGEKGYKVVLTSRDEAKGEAAVGKLQNDGLDVVYHRLDVTEAESVSRLGKYVDAEFGRVDALVNNAGVMSDLADDIHTLLEARLDTIKHTVETNVYGPILMSQALIPIMKKNGYGRVVNVSSGMGQLSDMSSGVPAYRISKTAINAVTRVLAHELTDSGILVNSACPGWVQTDMGGSGAPLTVEEGADTIVWLATLPDDGPTGGFFRKREPIQW